MVWASYYLKSSYAKTAVILNCTSEKNNDATDGSISSEISNHTIRVKLIAEKHSPQYSGYLLNQMILGYI